MKYLTVQQITCSDRAGLEADLEPLMDALLSLEEADDTIEDPDLAADLQACHVDVQMLVEAPDPAAAMVKAQATLRAPIHAVGGATPGWEPADAVMHVAPASAPGRLLASA